MSEEKCYSKEKDGTYCLGFPNRYALTVKEIEDIFMDFGNVVSVRACGDDRGFRFVRYNTCEEAESAVEGLKGNKKIRILPKKPKDKKENDDKPKNSGSRRKGNQDKDKDDEDDFNDAFKTDKAPTFQSSKKKKILPYGGIYNASYEGPSEDFEASDNGTDDGEKENMMKFLRLRSMRRGGAHSLGSDSPRNIDEGNESKFSASKKKGNQQNGRKKNDDDDDFSDWSKVEPEISRPNQNKKSRKLSENLKPKPRFDVDEFLDKIPTGENKNSSKSVRVDRREIRLGGNHSDFVPNSAGVSVSKLQKHPVLMDSLNDDEPPELVSTEELKQMSIKGSVCGDEFMKVVQAEEVIVANVHENFSVLYILYLLEKFEPISVTEMKTISDSGLRYCSVYFKSLKDVVAVEKQFDNFDLSGNRLIVRAPDLLANEIAAA